MKIDFSKKIMFYELNKTQEIRVQRHQGYSKNFLKFIKSYKELKSDQATPINFIKFLGNSKKLQKTPQSFKELQATLMNSKKFES